MLPYNHEKTIYETEELSEQLKRTTKKLLLKAHKLKAIEKFSKNEDINYELLKNLFRVRSINLEEISVKVLKEKDKFFVQIAKNVGCLCLSPRKKEGCPSAALLNGTLLTSCRTYQ